MTQDEIVALVARLDPGATFETFAKDGHARVLRERRHGRARRSYELILKAVPVRAGDLWVRGIGAAGTTCSTASWRPAPRSGPSATSWTTSNEDGTWKLRAPKPAGWRTTPVTDDRRPALPDAPAARPAAGLARRRPAARPARGGGGGPHPDVRRGHADDVPGRGDPATAAPVGRRARPRDGALRARGQDEPGHHGGVNRRLRAVRDRHDDSGRRIYRSPVDRPRHQSTILIMPNDTAAPAVRAKFRCFSTTIHDPSHGYAGTGVGLYAVYGDGTDNATCRARPPRRARSS